MKPLDFSWWKRWWLSLMHQIEQAQQGSSWNEEAPTKPDPLGWNKEARQVMEELEEMR